MVRGSQFEAAGKVPDFNPDTDSEEWGVILDMCRETMKQDPQFWTNKKKNIIGVSEETTTGVHRLYQMAEQGIATNVHYKPLPMMTAYKALGFDIQNYPNAYAHFVNEITLPLHTRLTDEEIDYIITQYTDILTHR